MEETKNCPYCGEEILAVAKKCKHCGEWLEPKDTEKKMRECPICGEYVSEDTEVCPYCNERITESEPVKEATILPERTDNPKNSGHQWLFYILLLIAIVAVVFYLIRATHQSKKEQNASYTDTEDVVRYSESDDAEDDPSSVSSTLKRLDEVIDQRQAEEVLDEEEDIVYLDTITGYDSEELIRLGEKYEKGIDAPIDLDKAFYYYEQAASTTDPAGLNKLGHMYADGLGCQQNYYLAARYYLKAAKQGNKYAQNNIGFCYWDGKGVEKNREEAVKWFRRSAAQGYEPAEKFLKNNRLN